MGPWSRRATLGAIFAGTAALIAAPLRAAGGFRVPHQPMALTRLLIRGLSDGKQVVIERRWLVNFAPKGAGVSVIGHQVGVRVDAPERIAAIAEIERNRSTDGMFPILLGANGLIETAGAIEQPQNVAAAVSKAQEMIAHAAMPLAEKQQAGFYLAQIQQAGGDMLKHIPRDLFYPSGSAIHETRPVDLPDGSRGEFELAYSAAADPVNGWLDHAERRITTRLAGSERSSLERWTMGSA